MGHLGQIHRQENHERGGGRIGDEDCGGEDDDDCGGEDDDDWWWSEGLIRQVYWLLSSLCFVLYCLKNRGCKKRSGFLLLGLM